MTLNRLQIAEIAELAGTVLEERPELAPLVAQTLRNLAAAITSR